jgi:hypothetical protein
MFGSNTLRIMALLLATSLTTFISAVAQDSPATGNYPISYTIESVPIPAAQEAAIAACYAQHKGTLYTYAGLNLTPTQIKNYGVITKSVGSRIGKINEKGTEKQDSSGGITMSLRDEDRSDTARELVIAAMDAVARLNLSPAEKLSKLNASHGKYAKFEYGRYQAFSNAQIKASHTLRREWENRMLKMMTPAQRTKFQSNIVSVDRYSGCAKDRPVPYSIQWFMGNFGDEGPKF